MIVCPNCNHSNPDGAQSCEACLTPLPSMTNCPHCGATVQADATFCGNCGEQLQPAAAAENETTVISTNAGENAMPSSEEMSAQQLEPTVTTGPVAREEESEATQTSSSTPLATSSPPASVAQKVPARSEPQAETPAASNAQTQLQQQSAKLLHVRTNQSIELPQHLPVIHIGKPNDKVPPDIDVSGFADSDVVSRIHANLRMEGDGYYIEDVGSANGTYINNMPLAVGNRHRLRAGDRISLGKNDLVTFLFQMS